MQPPPDHHEPDVLDESFAERQARLQKMEQELAAQAHALDVLEGVPVVAGDLSYRQRRFVEEYIVDLNGTQAAIRAGYSGPAETASKMLSTLKISQAVEKALATRSARVGMTRESVLAEMGILAESRLDHYIVTDDGQLRPAPGAPDGVMGAVQSIKRRVTTKTDKEGNVYKTYDVEFKLWDKPTPLRLMGKQVGLNFSDRVEVTGANGGPIVQRVLREVVDPEEITE